MKSYLYGLLFLMVLASCTSKNEGKAQKAVDFDLLVAGTISGNDTIVADTRFIAEKWGTVVKTQSNAKNNVQLKKFRIVKTRTIGEDPQDCYLLMASTPDGSIKVGTTLYLKENKFYFDVKEISGRKTSRIIICHGNCEDKGCLPQVVISDNEKHLVCSSCIDCEKITGQVY